MAKISSEEIGDLTAEVLPERSALSSLAGGAGGGGGGGLLGSLPLVGGLTQGLPLVGGG